MRKRERENPCGVCGHYHNHEEGEVCGICGHRPAVSMERTAAHPVSSAFPSEILKDFLYLGSYDNACRGELLRTQGISRILNTVPACQNLYKNSFTYYCLQDDKVLPFNDAIQFLEDGEVNLLLLSSLEQCLGDSHDLAYQRKSFLITACKDRSLVIDCSIKPDELMESMAVNGQDSEQCERDKARVLVHCMSGRSRSPAIVIAFLMKSRGWRLAHSLSWVKERRPSVDLFPAVYQQLVDFDQKLFEPAQSFSSMGSAPAFDFGITRPVHPATPAAATAAAAAAAPPPALIQTPSASIFDRGSPPSGPPGEFVFRAGLMSQQRVSAPSALGVNAATGAEAPMDSC